MIKMFNMNKPEFEVNEFINFINFLIKNNIFFILININLNMKITLN